MFKCVFCYSNIQENSNCFVHFNSSELSASPHNFCGNYEFPICCCGALNLLASVCWWVFTGAARQGWSSRVCRPLHLCMFCKESTSVCSGSFSPIQITIYFLPLKKEIQSHPAFQLFIFITWISFFDNFIRVNSTFCLLSHTYTPHILCKVLNDFAIPSSSQVPFL